MQCVLFCILCHLNITIFAPERGILSIRVRFFLFESFLAMKGFLLLQVFFVFLFIFKIVFVAILNFASLEDIV